MKSSSHLLPGKLPCQFASWTSTKTKIPNCIVFYCSTNHSGKSHGSTSPTNIYFFNEGRLDLVLNMC